MDVSDRRLQVQLTTQAKITSNFSSFEVIFAFVGVVSDLRSLHSSKECRLLQTLTGSLKVHR